MILRIAAIVSVGEDGLEGGKVFFFILSEQSRRSTSVPLLANLPVGAMAMF